MLSLFLQTVSSTQYTTICFDKLIFIHVQSVYKRKEYLLSVVFWLVEVVKVLVRKALKARGHNQSTLQTGCQPCETLIIRVPADL